MLKKEAFRNPANKWPDNHINNEDNQPVPFHTGQQLAWDSQRRIVAFIAGTQSGKALSVDTLIPTPFGFSKMGDLNIGDIVYGGNGKETKIVYVSETFYNHDCYKVYFDTGEEIVCDAEHLWIVRNYHQRKNDARRILEENKKRYLVKVSVTGSSVVSTKEINENFISENNGGSNYSVDLSLPIYCKDTNLPLHPYVLGVWLGDGHSHAPIITSEDIEIIEKIKNIGIEVSDRGHGNCGNAKQYSLGKNIVWSGRGRINSITEILKELNVRNNKHIPQMYLRASESSRRELLSGLLDTDGYCNSSGQSEFSSSNKILFDDFVELACSLGYKVRTRSKQPSSNGKLHKTAYTAVISSDESPFFLNRKRLLHKKPVKQNTKVRYITNIEKIESVPTKCIAVDNEEHSYLVGKSFIKTHNTSWGPFWLRNEIYRRHGGDFIAVTSTYDLFKLKMLPVMIHVFEHIYGIGRYWTGDKIIEIADPETGQFMAKKSQDRMWGRIILRSADALSGLESATARAGWMDECGQSQFSIMAYRAIRRRLALHRGRILMTTTLYDLGWLIEHIVEPAVIDGKTEYFEQNGGEIEYTDNERKDVAIIQLDSIVNPAFPRSEYDEAKESMSDEDFQMQYRGRKASRRFLIYDCFDPIVHVTEKFPIPIDWNRFVGVDFGSVHTAAVFYAEDPVSKILYCYREYLAGNTTISQHVINIRNGEPIRLRCVGGAGNEGQWRTEFTRNGLFVEESGIIDVNLGINRVYTQIKNNGIIYFKNVSGIIDEKNKYRRKRDSSTGEALDDIERKSDFHFTDCERYIISKIRPGMSTRARVINLWEAMNEQQQFSG